MGSDRKQRREPLKSKKLSSAQPSEESDAPEKSEEKKNRRRPGQGSLEKHPTKKDWYRARIRINGKVIVSPWAYEIRAAEMAMDKLRPARERHTLDEAITAFLNESGIEVATRGTYEHARDHYLRELKDKPIAAIDPDAVAALYLRMQERGLSRTIMNQCRAVIVGGWDYASTHQWTDATVNPGRAIPLPKPASRKKAEVESLTADERKVLLRALDESPLRLRWLIAVNLGLRPAEARGLTWDCVDWEGGTLTVRGQLQELKMHVNGRRIGLVYKRYTKTKSGMRTLGTGNRILTLLGERLEKQRRDQLLHPEPTPAQIARRAFAAGQLAEAKRQRKVAHEDDVITPPYDNLIFTRQNGSPLLASSDNEDWKALLRSAGLDHRRMYVARHTAISHLVRVGADINEVATLAGHSDPSFTKRVYVSNVENKAHLHHHWDED